VTTEGLSERELRLVELLEEVLERFRWMQVLGYASNFLLREKLKITEEERDRVLKAAAAAVEKDGKLAEWRERLARLKEDLVTSKREMKREMKRDMRMGNAGAAEESAGSPL
jgi:hypothetical protein